MQRSIVPPPPLLAKDFRYKSKIFQYPCNISPILIHPTLQKPSRKCLRYFMTYAKTHRPSIPPLLKPFDICLEYFLIRPVLQKLSKKCLKYFMILAKVLCTSDICLQFFTTHAKSISLAKALFYISRTFHDPCKIPPALICLSFKSPLIYV